MTGSKHQSTKAIVPLPMFPHTLRTIQVSPYQGRDEERKVPTSFFPKTEAYIHPSN